MNEGRRREYRGGGAREYGWSTRRRWKIGIRWSACQECGGRRNGVVAKLRTSYVE